MERVIVVADRGLNTSDNTAFLSGVNDDDSQGHDGYVYGQSVIGGDKKFKKWVLDKKDYTTDREIDENGEEFFFTHKSRVFAKTVTLKSSNGNRTLTMPIYQKQMVYYSSKYAAKQRKEREHILEKARDLINNPGIYKSHMLWGHCLHKNLSFTKETGEIADSKNLSLNIEKIEAEAKYDGYYSIVTSEKHLTDKQIYEIYRGLGKLKKPLKL